MPLDTRENDLESPRTKSDLPFGSEFSPSQIELRRVLEIAAAHAGDARAFEVAVRLEYFAGHNTTAKNIDKLANNCKLGAIAYGVIERDARLRVIFCCISTG